MDGTLYDFHTHSTLSDGTLSPIELIRRAVVAGYRAIAITDHVGLGSLERVLAETIEDCKVARRYWNITAVPGVELTHLPPDAIDQAAEQAKRLGAWIVVVHGETIVEPVEKGTNRAAIKSPYVDILAHPGLLATEDARLAAKNGTFIELSARRGHSFTNGHVVRLAQTTGLRLLLNSDAHDSEDLLTPFLAMAIARGAGLKKGQLTHLLSEAPLALLHTLPSSANPVQNQAL